MPRKASLRFLLPILFISLTNIIAHAGEKKLTGREIMEKQKDLHRVDSEYEELLMMLVDKSNNKEKRNVRRYIKKKSENEARSLLAFLGPKNIKGVALLNWSYKKKADDQWMYLPANGKMQRVASGSKKNYFMGTDFTYADLESDDFDNYNYKNLGIINCGDQKCYQVEAIPKDKKTIRQTGYSKRVMTITKNKMLTKEIKFFDRRKKHIKTQVSDEFKNIKGTVYRPKKTIMKRLSKKGEIEHRTLMLSKNLKVDENITDNTFSERFILKGSHIK